MVRRELSGINSSDEASRPNAEGGEPISSETELTLRIYASKNVGMNLIQRFVDLRSRFVLPLCKSE